jgi:hypothetical protein
LLYKLLLSSKHTIMSSFYEDASLVIIPSGYKTSKVYSAKPTDGAGDLSFTRSNDTATRVGPDGLIEKVRTNLALYSEQFENGYWAKVAATATADATTAPDGTTTADKIVATATSGNHFIRTTATQTGEFTFSVFAKASEYTNLKLQDVNAGTYNCTYDLSSGTASGTGASIQSVGSGWYRCSVTYKSSGSTVSNSLIGAPSTNVNYTGDGTSGIFVWGAMLETGVLTPYIATTSAAVSVGPVANVPRLDYLGSSCPRLLLEPQRQNLALFSESFDNAGWGKFQSTIVANTATSPDGYANADKIVPSVVLDVHQASQVPTLADSTSYAFSCFAKADGYNFLRLAPTTKAGATNSTFFNLSTGAVGTIGSGHTATIDNYGNGWYRCAIVYNSGAGASSTTIRVAVSQSDNQTSFAGNGTDGILIYGAQIEAGAYATSYIPTLGAAVTRGADVCNKTSVSGLIGQTEGTIFAEFAFPNIVGGSSSYFYITDGTFNNSVIIGREPASPTAKYFFWIKASGSSVLNNTANNVQSGFAKLAIGYKSGSWAAYLNGTLVASGTNSLTFGTMNRVAIGTNDAAQTITGESTLAKQAILFPTRLSNADLAALTA